MTTNKPILAGDPQAIDKLQDRLHELEKKQQMMKGVNAHYRKYGVCRGAPGITDEQALALEDKIAHPVYSSDCRPYSLYTMTLNYREITRLKNRIAEITRNREVGFVGWAFDGGRVEANTEMNRLQLFFDKEPGEQQRALLKIYGFRWTPSQNAWQRQLSDKAIHAAGQLWFVSPSDGRAVRDFQPQTPTYAALAR